MSRIANIFAACLAAFACTSKAQWDDASVWNRGLSAINDTTPAGLKPRSERAEGSGWFHDQWESGKALAARGRMNLFLPAYTYHSPSRYDNFEQENAYPYGAGIASYDVDDKDNERMLFVLAFSDSHYNIEPIAGYMWVARWRLFGPVKGGLGYTAFLTARNDTRWVPVPAVLPVASLGTDAVSMYAVFIPTQYVTFVYLRLSPDALGSAPRSGAADGRDVRRNLVYAGYGYVNTDPSGLDGIAGTNGSGPVVGYRRFFGEHFAVEFSAERSRHSLSLPQQALGSFQRNAYTLAAQYHFPIAQRVQLYGGIGVAYERVSHQQMADVSLESNSVGPVVQGGFSVALDSVWTVTGGIRTGYPRTGLTLNGAPANILLAPVTFSLALGARF